MTPAWRDRPSICLQVRGAPAAGSYFLEAVGQTTWVRLRSARRVRDVRAPGDLLKVLGGAGLFRGHRNHAVNVRHVLEVRRRSAHKGWEVKLAPPVNQIGDTIPIPRARTGNRVMSPIFEYRALGTSGIPRATAPTRSRKEHQ